MVGGAVMSAPSRRPGRRAFVAALGGAAAALVRSVAPRAATLPRVVFAAVGAQPGAVAFRAVGDALRARGQIGGATFDFALRTTDDVGARARLAAEIVASRPDIVIVLESNLAYDVAALTRDIPVVVAFAADPVATGLTTNVARPSRNITGISNLHDVLIGKRIELVTTLVAGARRVGLLYDLTSPLRDHNVAAAREAAAALGVEVVPIGVTTATEVAAGLDAALPERVDGLIVASSPLVQSQRPTLIAAALRHRRPLVMDFWFEVDEGALAAYGPDTAENFQRTADYVDRLLRGARVADLPFDAPRQVIFSLNLRTARAIGLATPPTLLAPADEVIV
jgi:putative ABC transport system substrate-binding protein